MVQFWTELLGSIGPGIIAGLIIVLWDVARIYIQSKWLVRKLNQKSECQRCQTTARLITAIAQKLEVENDSERPSVD
jgi:hypothetical protein